MVKDSDIVLVMEKEQLQTVAEKFPEAKEKVKMLSSYNTEYQGQEIKDPR
jgi:protein-tyrosine-phosphatase